jgi:hypothetical protein
MSMTSDKVTRRQGDRVTAKGPGRLMVVLTEREQALAWFAAYRTSALAFRERAKHATVPAIKQNLLQWARRDGASAREYYSDFMRVGKGVAA